MTRGEWLCPVVAVLAAQAAGATDFGIRVPGRLASPAIVSGIERPHSSELVAAPSSAFRLNAAASLGSQWGRVTSTFRSPEHNRAVGGVPNSWHVKGRAIDIARRAGVTHAMIAAAFRAAGYQLIESLDEGDHSHFAFAVGGGLRVPDVRATSPELTRWGIVTVASASR